MIAVLVVGDEAYRAVDRSRAEEKPDVFAVGSVLGRFVERLAQCGGHRIAAARERRSGGRCGQVHGHAAHNGGGELDAQLADRAAPSVASGGHLDAHDVALVNEIHRHRVVRCEAGAAREWLSQHVVEVARIGGGMALAAAHVVGAVLHRGQVVGDLRPVDGRGFRKRGVVVIAARSHDIHLRGECRNGRGVLVAMEPLADAERLGAAGCPPVNRDRVAFRPENPVEPAAADDGFGFGSGRCVRLLLRRGVEEYLNRGGNFGGVLFGRTSRTKIYRSPNHAQNDRLSDGVFHFH